MTAMTSVSLQKQIRCINCWARFPPEDVVWISESRQLFGDQLLGSDFAPRFQTLRFSPEGDGIDAYGARCTEVACPRCHLTIPRDLLSMRPFFVSVLGSPACGKSFFLAAMTWKLRRTLPQAFALDFTDADRISNQALSDYERSVFMSTKPAVPTLVGHLIPKTQLQGSQYNTVLSRGQSTLLPKPLSFRITPTADHPEVANAESISRILCVYDNAGEHFLPGRDSGATPGTRHLAVSDLLLFLYDPLQDPRFVQAVGDARLRRYSERFSVPLQQELILRECMERISRHKGVERSSAREPQLVVVVTKSDEWLPAVAARSIDLVSPFAMQHQGSPRCVNLTRLQDNSQQLRSMLMSSVPDIVHAAESVSKSAIFVAASALGTRPELDSEGRQMLRPADIQPEMVELPVCAGLALRSQGLVKLVKER